MVQAKRKVIEFEPDDAITANKDRIIKIQQKPKSQRKRLTKEEQK